MPEPPVWPAPAKLNLFLHVTGQRGDGYHELQTVFQLLDWGDEIVVEVAGDGKIRRVTDIPGVPEALDLGIRAAVLLREACDVCAGARIAVRKRIPAGAGLGGASSDAATVLHALNRLWGCGLNEDALAELGLELGADVPLFVRGHSAWAEGIGERLVPLDLPEAYYVVVVPSTRVATASVFGDPGLRRDSPPLSRDEVLREGDFGRLGNDCEEVVLARYPELRALAEALSRYGRWRLTGTGSAFFLATETRSHAEQITSELKSHYNVRAAAGVNRSPLSARLAAGLGGG